ncbi:MAG TPA: hypothetical protein VJJ55_01860, partial [Candidatus Paceibacterota bacterium]
PPNFKNISLGFANPPSRKIVSQNRVHFFRTAHFLPFEPFSVLSHFPFLESSVLRTEACVARARKR